jgi:hypothetical protein
VLVVAAGRVARVPALPPDTPSRLAALEALAGGEAPVTGETTDAGAA